MPSATRDETSELLRAPSSAAYETLQRRQSTYHTHHDFDLAKAEGYQQQYGDLYFLRLAKLKPAVERLAGQAWDGFQIAGDTVNKVERVLDVRQGEFCWVVGTIYMDMPLKPNILEDISRDLWIAAPPPREKYTSPDGKDKIMLEDESGRLRLIGSVLNLQMLVTGCVVAVMGTENKDGDFEVIDVKAPDLPSIPPRWSIEDKSKSPQKDVDRASSSKIALVSGLSLTGSHDALLPLDLLTEYLLGESTNPALPESAAQISPLIIAGNSLARANPILAHEDQLQPASTKKSQAGKKYGYDASAYNPNPPAQLDAFLSDILPSLPVTLIPGASDPANVSLPQQPLHPALFPLSRVWADPPVTKAALVGKTVASNPLGKAKPPTATAHPFHPGTNPSFLSIAGHLVLVTGGQPTQDIEKYLPDESYDSHADLVEATLRWRNIAPTAPDTLWCYPYQTGDPFVLPDNKCPSLYVVGNCERFETRLVRPLEGGAEGQEVRIVCVPQFSKTGEVVLVDTETLEVEVLKFHVADAQRREDKVEDVEMNNDA